MIRVRATINLHRLRAGAVALVDPRDPYVALCIGRGYLVAVKEER